MTLTSNNFDDPNSSTTDILDGSSGWEALYCSHLWSNSELRKVFINAPLKESKVIKYCYTCKGKIRKYELKSSIDNFLPNNHSTPNGKLTIKVTDPTESLETIAPENNSGVVYPCSRNPIKDNDTMDVDVEIKQYIPSISHQIDSSFRQKYKSYEIRPNDGYRQRRLRKSLKGIGCIVNFALTDSPVKKRTQIQACSISVMIIAIVVISFILVNFTTPNFTRASNVVSTIVVPTKQLDLNETSSYASTNIYSDGPSVSDNLTTEYDTTTEQLSTIITESTSLLSNVLTKIRKNIKTYTKHSSKNKESVKPKDIINRDLSQRFCSCQKDEVCMLDENSGTAVCRKYIDTEDPTGCGGLCALETEACQLVDRARGVRVCRSLTLVTCSPQEWRCRNGLCVPAEARCDGVIQCYDRSDEMHCECDLTKQFRCGHSISCFANTKLCNGVIDCWDGYDEVNCTTECPETQFTCTDGQCILSSRFCDGLADCADRSDEPLGCDGDCRAHEMRCNNRRCVSRNVICDGHDNCGDETDELHCAK